MLGRSKTYKIKDGIFYFSGLVVFITFVVLTVWGNDGIIHLMELRGKKQELLDRNQFLLQENLLIVEEIEQLKHARYMEQKARTDLGMVRDDEIVYVIK